MGRKHLLSKQTGFEKGLCGSHPCFGNRSVKCFYVPEPEGRHGLLCSFPADGYAVPAGILYYRTLNGVPFISSRCIAGALLGPVPAGCENAGPGARTLLPRQRCSWCPEVTIRHCPHSQASLAPVPRLLGSFAPISVGTGSPGAPGAVQGAVPRVRRQRGQEGLFRSRPRPSRPLVAAELVFTYSAPRASSAPMGARVRLSH